MYLYNRPNWPIFEWNSEHLMPLISYVRNKQGKLIGKMGALGFELRNELIQVRNEFKQDIAALRTDMHKTLNDQTWKLVTFVVAANGIMLAALKYLG